MCERDREREVGWLVLQRINPFRSFKLIRFQTIQFSMNIVFVYKRSNVKTVLLQTMHFSISIHFQCQKQSYYKQFSLAKVQTDLFKTVQFSISTQFSSIWPIDRTLSGATNPAQSGQGNDGTGGVLCIPQSSCITGTSPSDCFVSKQDPRWGSLTPLQRSSRCILQPQPTKQRERQSSFNNFYVLQWNSKLII